MSYVCIAHFVLDSAMFGKNKQTKLELNFVNMDLTFISLCDIYIYVCLLLVYGMYKCYVMFFHLGFSSSLCSNKTFPKGTLNGGFTLIYICVSACWLCSID
jgi:hypothetical protein